MKHNFEERKQNRIDNAHKQAVKNSKLSEDYYVRAKQMASFIPFGQPILVGHHSEKADRNYRGKIDNNFRKSFEADKKASYYTDKADSIESNTAIFSDDPQAVEKLQKELDTLLETQEFMKAANACIRKQDKAAFLKLKYATAEIWQHLNTPDYLKRTGFPSYKLTNNGANIRRIRQRIEQLKRVTEREAKEVFFVGGSISENKEANRIQIVFEAKPDEATRQILKRQGFRWCRSESAWQRHLNGNGIYAARIVLQQLTALNNK